MTMTNAGSGDKYFRRVGTTRPSHMLYSAGVGSVMDLPGLSVLVQGLDHWDYSQVVPRTIPEERLLASVRALLGPQVSELRPPPWMPDDGGDPAGPWSKVGVPVIPFPQWLRCTACDRLGRLDDGQLWRLDNKNARRPDLARFVHTQCVRRNEPPAVPARFMLACPEGHLDEFPWVTFIHYGKECPNGTGSRLTMQDMAGNIGPNVVVRCECGAHRNMIQAVGAEASSRLAHCRGRHPHLGEFEGAPCPRAAEVRTLILGASNQWFAVSLSALHLPSGAQGVAAAVEAEWGHLKEIESRDILAYALKHQQDLVGLRSFGVDEVWKAVAAQREAEKSGRGKGGGDLRAPEYDVLTNPSTALMDDDFLLREVEAPSSLRQFIEQVVLVERLREVKAFVGFSRLDAPEWGGKVPTGMVRLSRDGKPQWVPAAETRGEGIFIRLREDAVASWEARTENHPHMASLRAAYARFRKNRGREGTDWPPERYWLLHTLSHMLIRQMALECGYSSASLAERIYARTADEAEAGILIYTAASDSEGTLGGLVALGTPGRLEGLLLDAFDDARWCSSDPLCAEREPIDPDDSVNGAACHACLFLSETTCERGNRFLDRSFVVPVADPALSLLTQ
jgi:Domain of unknown function (DUF1998)